MGTRWLFRIVLAIVAIGAGIYRFFAYGYSDGNILNNGLLLIIVGTIIFATALWHYWQVRRF